MNAYYQKNNKTTLVTDGNLFPEVNFGDRLISVLCAIVAFFSSVAVVRIAKATFGTVLFLAFFGIVGGMESGNVGTFAGLLLCAAVSFVEFLTLKSMIRRRKESSKR